MARTRPTDDRARPILAGGEQLVEPIERSGGGAAPWHPRTFEDAAAILAPQAAQVAAEIDAMDEALRGPHVVVEAKVLPNYLAGSHYPDDLLRALNLYTVGTRQSRGTYRTKSKVRHNEPTKTYLIAGPDESFEQLAELIRTGPGHRGQALWEDIRELDTIALPSVDLVLRGTQPDAGEGELVTWEAVLSPLGATDSQRERFGADMVERFVRLVESTGGEVDRDFIRQVGSDGGLTFLPIAVTAADAPRVARFNALRVMRPMPRIADLDLLRADVSAAPVQRAMGTRASGMVTGPKVAVFDGGLEPGDRQLDPYVRLHEVSPEPPWPRGVRHGTMVTSAVLFGYDAISTTPPKPLVTVDHYRVLPPPRTGTTDTDFYWVLDRIVDFAVAHQHRVVNLSLGPQKCVDDDAEPHRWTAELDRLADEHGILFVTAAGNNGERPENRVQVPADMANGLAVGACTSRNETRPVQRAGYSAIGPGRPGQRCVPVGVNFGGSRNDSEPFRGRGPRGRVEEDQGTSFAAPLTTHGITRLHAMLNGVARPDTLRAFAAHFAHGQRGRGQDQRHIGYGRLRESYDDVWDCGPFAVTVLYDLTLRRDNLVMVPFPVPRGIRGNAKVEIEFTVCYTSPVQPAHASDYARAGLELTFRPDDRVHSLFDPATKKIVTPRINVVRERARVEKYVAEGMVLSQHPVSRAGWRRTSWEGDQRDAGKWDTLVRAPIRMYARGLHNPRMDVEYLARDGARLVRQGVPDLSLTLLVTVRAPNDVALYDRVREQLDVLTPLVPVVVMPQIQVRGPGRTGSP